MKNKYSLDGVKCYDCPTGAKCSQYVRTALEVKAIEYGTASPRTDEGYYLFHAPATKQERICDWTKWKDSDPCKVVAKESKSKNVTDIIHTCSLRGGFKDAWTSDRVFACLSGSYFYHCDVSVS
jgi:hypothetical protein